MAEGVSDTVPKDLHETLHDAVQGQLESLGAELKGELKNLSAELLQAVRDELRGGPAFPTTQLEASLKFGPPPPQRQEALLPSFRPVGRFRSDEISHFFSDEMDNIVSHAQHSNGHGHNHQPSPPHSECTPLDYTGDVSGVGEAVCGFSGVAAAEREAEGNPGPRWAARRDSEGSDAAAGNAMESCSERPPLPGEVQDTPVDPQASPSRRLQKKPKPVKQETLAERALGLMPSTSNTGNVMNTSSRTRRLAQKLVQDARFEAVSSVLIVLSAAHIGIQTDYMARHIDDDEAPLLLRVIDMSFCAAFTVELSLRLYAYREQFFCMYGWGWNLFDFTLISSQLIELFLTLMASSTGIFGSSDLLRVVRVLRTVRAVRVLHVMRFASDLQMLVSCLMHSAKTFVWALGLLMMVIYLVAVYLVQVVTQVRVVDKDKEFEDLESWFASLPRAVLSLFQGLTGGADWGDMLEPLIREVSPWLGLFFPMFIAFVLILVMNVVSATFVEAAIDRAATVRDLQKMAHASRLFKTLDQDRSGYISMDEVMDDLERVEVQDFFRSIDVDVSEAKCLFELIDVDRSGEIEMGEFLGGCLRLQGPAKSMDMVVAFHHLNHNLDRLVRLMRPVQGQAQ